MQKKPIKFTLNGKSFDPHVACRTKPALLLIMHFLDTLPDGTLADTPELAAKLGRSKRSMREHSVTLRERGYAAHLYNRNYYGNPRTIAELLKEGEI